jgi:hypothetical protein
MKKLLLIAAAFIFSMSLAVFADDEPGTRVEEKTKNAGEKKELNTQEKTGENKGLKERKRDKKQNKDMKKEMKKERKGAKQGDCKKG